MTDVRGDALDHDFIERKTFVIGEDHRMLLTCARLKAIRIYVTPISRRTHSKPPSFLLLSSFPSA